MQQFFWLTVVTCLTFFTLMAHGLPTTNTHLKRELEDVVEDHTDAVDDIIGKLPSVGNGLSGVRSYVHDVGGDVHVADDFPCDVLPLVCGILPGDNDLYPGDNDLLPGDNDLLPGDNDLLPGDNDLLPGDGDFPVVGDLPDVD